MSLMNKTIKDFNNILASKEPAPGGGSTAALSGLLAASLTMMVVNLSLGKKFFELLDGDIKDKIMEDYKAIKVLNKDLEILVDEDTKAFLLFMEALKLPKETEEEKSKRIEAIHHAGKYALEIPLTVSEKCLAVLRHQLVIAEYGNINAVSDVGVGALMALSGLEGAILNVKINLPGIVDDKLKKEAKYKIDNFRSEGIELKTKIMEIVNIRIEK